MRASIVLRRSAVLGVLPVLTAVAAGAQEPRVADPSLQARMEAFLREIPEFPNDGMAAFFPRRGEWTWVQSYTDEWGRIVRTGVFRRMAARGRRLGRLAVRRPGLLLSARARRPYRNGLAGHDARPPRGGLRGGRRVV